MQARNKQPSPHHQEHSSSNLHGKNSGSDLIGGAPLTPQLLPIRSDRSSLDRVSFSSSTMSDHSCSHLTPPMERPSSAGSHPLSGRPHVLSGRPRLSSSFNAGGTQDLFSAVPDEERYSVGATYHTGARESSGHGYLPRPEPDGQSDVSCTSPDLLLRHPRSSRGNSATRHRVSGGSVLSLSPPPPSPSPTLTITHQDNEGTKGGVIKSGCGHTKIVTPAMIQSALDALEGIQDKATPLSLGLPRHPSLDSTSRQSPVLPGDVTSALTAWISSQSIHRAGVSGNSSVSRTPLLTPPPTPRGQILPSESSPGDQDAGREGGRQGISARDLISALTTLMCPGDEKSSSSRESRVCSVPACTPREGLSEWARMGIRPEEVIQALSALTIHQVHIIIISMLLTFVE